MSRASQEVFAARLAETEQTMIRLRSSYRVEQALSQKYNVQRRQVRRWMQQVRKKWKEEASGEEQDRTTLRADMDKTLNEIIAQAFTRTVVVKDADGNPMLDPNPNSNTYGKPIIKANPDLQRALHALIQLRALHALDQPAQIHHKVDVSADLKKLPTVAALTDSAREKLRDLLKEVSPGGDLMALAGDWFDDKRSE